MMTPKEMRVRAIKVDPTAMYVKISDDDVTGMHMLFTI